MSAIRRFIRTSKSDSSGQTLTLVAIFMPILLAMLGLAIDTGNIYVAKRHLQTATDSAALAAAQDLPNGTQALADSCTFSATRLGGSCPAGPASKNGHNVNAELTNISTSAQLECLSVASAGANCVTGTGCSGAFPPAGDGNDPGCNAVKVTQSGTVKTFLLGFLGFSNIHVTASSTAAMAGGRSSPLDVEVVLDSTRSMQTYDNCGAPDGTSGVTGIPYSNGSTPTAEDCAKAGMRALLETLYPCSPDDSQHLVSCGTATSNNYSDPEDEVGLMTLPPPAGNPNATGGRPAYVSPGNGLGIPAETNCITDLSGGGYFNSPNGSDTSTSNYDPSNMPEYQIVPLSSDYKLSNATSPVNDSLLNPNSNLVKAVYWGKCPGGVYPASGGSQGSSLSTPTSGDYSTGNNNNSTPIAGGPNAANYSTKTSNSGVSTIAGFPTAGNSTTASASSTAITINRPGTPAANDYVVVVVTAKGVGSSGVTLVCAPSDWTPLSQAGIGTGANRITQAVFGSVRSSASAESYSFTFVNSSTGNCGASTQSLSASALAVRYTGVDPYDPVDVAGAPVTGTSTSPAPAAVTTTYANDHVVSLYSAPGTSITGLTTSTSGVNPASAVRDTAQAAAGASAVYTGTITSGNWAANAIALKPMQGSSSISVTRPTPAAAGDYVLVSVTASDVGSSGSLYVCPPNDGTWTTVSENTQGSGVTALTQATFGSRRTGASDPAYSFTLVNGTSCASTSPAAVQASAVATRYTGVDAVSSVEVAGTPAGGTSGVSGSAITPPTVTTSHANDQIVRIYSDASSTITLQNGQQAGQSQTNASSSNVTFVTDKAQAASGPTTTPTTATTAAAHNWIAQTVALEPQQGQTTIAINRPSTRAAGDLLIVSVTVQGQVSICAPDASWTDVGTGAIASGTGASDVTTEAFYSYRSSQDPMGQSYTFSFFSGACNTPTAVARPATAVAVRYSGANPVAPVEVAASKIGSGTNLTTAPVTTGNINDAVVSLYGSSATSFSSGVAQSVASTDTASAYETTVQGAPGTTSTQSATAANGAPWVSLTVAVAASDGGCSGHCTYGLEDPGGASTYYANAITAAKAALDSAAAGRPDAKKVIILLSDGVANVYSNTPCQDAIQNAMSAETATSTTSAATIYTIAYGSSSDNCTDNTTKNMGTIQNGMTMPISGACTMRMIADNPNTDTTHGLSGGSLQNARSKLCSSIASDPPEHFYLKASGSDLASVFREIGLGLTSPRLVSDSAT